VTQTTAQKPTGINRRELLNYAWLASMAMLLANAGGVGLLFAFPRFRGIGSSVHRRHLPRLLRPGVALAYF